MIDITNKEFETISNYMKINYGIKLGESKKNLIKGRLQSILLEKNIDNFSDYYDYVVTDKTGMAVTELVNKLTTNYTYFMREPTHFNYLKDYILPDLCEKSDKNELLFWSAGCSTGEEAYTIAMILNDYMKLHRQYKTVKILATDISIDVLESAKEAEYNNVNFSSLPPNWKHDYFNLDDSGKAIVDNKIKNMIKLAYLNLKESYFPIRKKFNVIFCRNVMIYFDNKSKDDLIERFYDMLVPGGYLFIGHSESLNRDNTRFKYVKPAIYRKGI